MTKAVLLTASALLWSVQAFTAGPAHAAAGALDPTFGQGGQVTISFSNNNVIVEDAILQPDGKIAVAAMFTEIVADANASDSFGVVRLLPNGSLDPNFGTGGAARIAFGNFDATPNVLALQPGGKIVVVGQGAFLSQWVAARFNGNGTLDSSFGAGGTAQTNIAGFQSGLTSISSILIDPRNAQILVGGSGRVCTKCATETVIVRYNPNGSLDPTFGNGGMIAIAAVGAPDALALLSNGDILATGSGAVAEFEASGSLLSTVMSTISSATIVAAAQGGQTVFEANGDFVFASSAPGEFGRRDTDIQLVRFLPQGSVDSTFNSPIFDFGAEAAISESARSLAVQPNGQILAGGAAGQFGAAGFGLARFNANGGFDATFGNAGKVTTPFANASAGVRVVMLQSDGRIIAVGNALSGGQENLAAARYLGQ
jgi:uncharacterized delta-60 repeat protein